MQARSGVSGAGYGAGAGCAGSAGAGGGAAGEEGKRRAYGAGWEGGYRVGGLAALRVQASAAGGGGRRFTPG